MAVAERSSDPETFDRSWLAGVLREHADELVKHAVHEVIESANHDGDPLDRATTRHIEESCRQAVERFLDLLQDPTVVIDKTPFTIQGRLQRIAGRSLPELLGFYRIAESAIWRRATEMPELCGADAELMLLLGLEATALVQQLSVASLEGYLEQEEEDRRLARSQRERLVQLLLGREPVDTSVIEEAARDARWPLPERLRVAVGERVPGDPELRDPPDRVLVDTRLPRSVRLIVADDVEWPSWLERARTALRCGPSLAVGPAVAPGAASTSASRASALWELMRNSAIDGGPLVSADEHELDLLLGADEALAREFTEERLALLAPLAPAARSRAIETLAAWLAHRGSPTAVAEQLGIHVQTARYRIRRLHELLGERLDDPQQRFELELAVRIERSLRPSSGHPSGAAPTVSEIRTANASSNRASGSRSCGPNSVRRRPIR